MKHHLLVDNWTLQNVGEILCLGSKPDEAHELILSSNLRSYSYRLIPADVVRIEALCQLLHNIVLTDHLHLDAEYTGNWNGFSPLLKLHKEGILKPRRFRDKEDEWLPFRAKIAKELCPDPDLRRSNWQSEDISDTNPSKAKDRYYAQLLWGGSGMLARANHFELTYASHPQRERFFARANFMSGSNSASVLFRNFMNSARIRLFERLDVLGYKGDVMLPPIAIEIISEAADINQLVSIAIQKRAHYRKLRTWLGAFQNALTVGDHRQHSKKRQLLDDITSQFENKTPSNLGETSVSVGVSWPTLNLNPGAIWKAVRNRFGVRAQINKLILAPRGERAIKKLIRMIGEGRTQHGNKLEQEIFRRCKNYP